MVRVVKKMVAVIMLSNDGYGNSINEDNDRDNAKSKPLDMTTTLSGFKDALLLFITMPDHVPKFMVPVSTNYTQS